MFLLATIYRPLFLSASDLRQHCGAGRHAELKQVPCRIARGRPSINYLGVCFFLLCSWSSFSGHTRFPFDRVKFCFVGGKMKLYDEGFALRLYENTV